MGISQSTAKSPQAPPTLTFPDDTAQLLASGKYSDLTIVCGERKWAVHKSIVCLQSGFFAKACDGQFREAHENIINLSEDDPSALAAMISYFYHREYTETSNASLSLMIFHARVYSIADKYMIEGLRKIAEKRIKQCIDNLKSEEVLAEAVSEIYDEDRDIAESLKERLLQGVGARLKSSFGSESGESPLHETAISTPVFATDLLRLLTRPESLKYLLDDPLDIVLPYRHILQKAAEAGPVAETQSFQCPECAQKFDAEISPLSEFTHQCGTGATCTLHWTAWMHHGLLDGERAIVHNRMTMPLIQELDSRESESRRRDRRSR